MGAYSYMKYADTFFTFLNVPYYAKKKKYKQENKKSKQYFFTRKETKCSKHLERYLVSFRNI